METVLLSLLNILAFGCVTFFAGRLYQQAKDRQLRLAELDELVKGFTKTLANMETLNIIEPELLCKTKDIASDVERAIKETKKE